ncbi:MAG: RNA methyltransferase [bacterium]|nr:RNA methyltransferase [bacterium]
MSKDTSIIVLAHNIRSLWNIGSLFRTSDAFGVEKLILTGYTGTPPRREISKTAIGADEWVIWEQKEDPIQVIQDLRSQGYKVVALEQSAVAIDISTYTPPSKICLILGHEVTGVPEEQLTICDDHIYIPMHGKKESINVSVAAGIALERLRHS